MQRISGVAGSYDDHLPHASTTLATLIVMEGSDSWA